MTTSPCFLCEQPETEPLKQAKRNQLTPQQLENILDADMTVPGFMDLVARFYGRGGHKRFGQSGPDDAEDIGTEAHEQGFEETEIRCVREKYGSALLPLPRKVAEKVPGYRFDLVLEELAGTASDTTVLNRNGLRVGASDTGIGFWGDDDDDGDFFDAMSTRSSPVKPAASAEHAQLYSSMLASPGSLSTSSANSQHPSPTPAELTFPQPIFGVGDLHRSSPVPMGLGIETLTAGHSRKLSASMQTTPAVTTAQDRYPSPIPLASPIPDRLSHNPHSPSQPMGPPATPAQTHPATPTRVGKKRSFDAIGASSQPATPTPHTQAAPLEPGMSITFDTKRFKTTPKSKSRPRGKKGSASSGTKKTIRVITDPPVEDNSSRMLAPAPTPASTPTSTSASAPAPPTTLASVPDALQRDSVDDIILQCQKVREAAVRRREEEMGERMQASGRGPNGVLGVQGQNIRVHK